MSLTGKLAKIAIGIAVAKGVKKMMGGNKQASGGGIGSILGQLGQANQGQSGGLGSILGQLGQNSGGQSGGLGSLLGQLGGSSNQASSGGLGGLLGSLAGAAGGASNQSGGVGGLLGSLLGGGQSSQAAGGLGSLLGSLTQSSGGGSAGGLGGLLNQAMNNFGEPEQTPSAEDEQAAGVLLSAMLQAAKADGQIDEEEKAAIMEHLSDATPDEMAFIQQQFNAPVDPEGLAQSIPNGMQQQAYAMSLLAIDLDNSQEAQYLDSFAKSLGLDAQTVNGIHAQMNEPALYS